MAFTGKQSTNLYLEKCVAANLFLCPECGKIFQNKLRLKRHIQVSHRNPLNEVAREQQYILQKLKYDFEADKIFKSYKEEFKKKEDLEAIVSVVGFFCPFCRKYFKNSGSMLQHLWKRCTKSHSIESELSPSLIEI